jgi:uncharacterized protein (TIGR02453 family)
MIRSHMASPFTQKTLSFLRALARNNDREWFRARKPEYERHVRGPMIELLDRLARDFPSFAPELVSDPKVSLYRIYRDTRFSEDKSPLKTHVAAHFPARGFARGAGAGLYLEVGPASVWAGGGIYMPSSADLQAIREHIAAHHLRLHRIVTAPAFLRVAGPVDGARLTRVPRGYRGDHPAADYLRFKQFLAGRDFAPAFALQDAFYPAVLQTFRATAPLVRFLNTALLAGRGASPTRLDDSARPGRAARASRRPPPGSAPSPWAGGRRSA